MCASPTSTGAAGHVASEEHFQTLEWYLPTQKRWAGRSAHSLRCLRSRLTCHSLWIQRVCESLLQMCHIPMARRSGLKSSPGQRARSSWTRARPAAGSPISDTRLGFARLEHKRHRKKRHTHTNTQSTCTYQPRERIEVELVRILLLVALQVAARRVPPGAQECHGGHRRASPVVRLPEQCVLHQARTVN